MYPSTDAPVRRRNGRGLGIDPITAGTTIFKIGTDIFGGKASPRSGGADPCCPDALFKGGVTVANANVGGAPPDYRDPYFGRPSASGVGRLKDDVCDCIPIPWNGKMWVIDTGSRMWVETGGALTAPSPPAGTPLPPPPGAQPPPPEEPAGLDIAKLLPLAAGAFFLLRR